MGRSPRISAPNTWHHITSRGADRQDLFSDDADRLRFEGLLEGTVENGIEVHAYCLMSNHFHLLLRCHDDNVSAAMQTVCGTYARTYNERHGRSGPLFEARFHSVVITSDEQLVRTTRYVHRNPLDIVHIAALAAYRWSSYGPYVGTRDAPSWLTFATINSLLDRDGHRTLVETPDPSDQTPARGNSASTPALGAIEASVAATLGTTIEALRRPAKGCTNPGRTMALMLAVRYRAATTRALAERYGVASTAAVRVAARRGRVLLHDDASFRRLSDRVLANLLRGA